MKIASRATPEGLAGQNVARGSRFEHHCRKPSTCGQTPGLPLTNQINVSNRAFGDWQHKCFEKPTLSPRQEEWKRSATKQGPHKDNSKNSKNSTKKSLFCIRISLNLWWCRIKSERH